MVILLFCFTGNEKVVRVHEDKREGMQDEVNEALEGLYRISKAEQNEQRFK